MRVFLDDERKTLKGWVRVYWPDEVIELLKTGRLLRLALIMILEMMSEVQATMLFYGLKKLYSVVVLYLR
jgi:hypothetical protein